MQPQKTLSAGQALVRLLANYGVDTVFGIPGVHTLELYRGLPGSGIRHVLTRHEQGAGFMADGYARVSGKPGVCFVITGPGVTNVATAIGQAYADSVPLLVISSVNHSASLGKGWGCLHETQDQRAMTAPITAFSALALSPEQLPELIARAYAVFDSERPRPVHISIPLDVLAAPVAHDWSAAVARRPGRGVPCSEALRAAAERLAAARRPMLIAGGGALAAGEALAALSERLAAPLFTSVAGKGLLPPDAPLNAGASLCVAPGWEMIAEADLVLAVGTEMADTDFWRERLPLSGELIRVDIDPRKFNDFYPSAVALRGDARQTLEALLARLPQEARDAAPAAARVARLRAEIRAAHAPLQALHQAILDRIAAALPADAFVSTDMTQLAYTGNYAFASRAPRSWLHPPATAPSATACRPASAPSSAPRSARAWCWSAMAASSTPRRNWPPPARNWTVRWWCYCGTTTRSARSATTCSAWTSSRSACCRATPTSPCWAAPTVARCASRRTWTNWSATCAPASGSPA